MPTLYETQCLIEKKYNKNQRPKLIRKSFLECPEITTELRRGSNATGLTENLLLALLCACADKAKIQLTVLIGMVQHLEEPEQIVKGILWLAENNLFDLRVAHNGYADIYPKYFIDEKTMNIIDQYQYLPPMLVPPLEVTSNRGSGHLTIHDDSLLLKDNHHEYDIALDVINKFNQVPLCLDERVIRNMRDDRKHLNSPKKDETIEDYQKRVNDFKDMEKKSMRVFAMLINEGNEFYLTHKYDKRGRIYAQGYHVSYQGNCYRKAIINFSKKELIND